MNGNGQSGNFKEGLATVIVKACGLGKAVVVGRENGVLVAGLLRVGVDAVGVEATPAIVDKARRKYGERFIEGLFFDMPFKAEEFDGAVLVDCLEYQDPDAVAQILSEASRVARSYIFVRVSTVNEDPSQTIFQKRDWWERQCFDAGLRRHPAYFKLTPYELLNSDGPEIFILLEKVSPEALLKFPASGRQEDQALTGDMSRTTGALSDAQRIRYYWSAAYIKPGDRVLDTACGLGYGSYLLSRQTHSTAIHGLDTGGRAIEYAIANFGPNTPKLSYAVGSLPGCLADIPDASYDVILSFETLEKDEKPEVLLTEFHRLLAPGGRLVVSVPNGWSNETGNGSNPGIYDWGRLTRQVAKDFLIEDRYLLNARQAKTPADPRHWVKKGRELRQVPAGDVSALESEWCLMTAMKSPLASNAPYEERPFSNIAGAGHNARYKEFYANPWLVHSVVNFGFRMKNQKVLLDLCDIILSEKTAETNDYAAALCVKAYLNLERGVDAPELSILLSRIDSWLLIPPHDVMQLRWRVSLLFVKAKTLTALGNFVDAIDVYKQCYSCDIEEFGVHLATKITEAFYWAGRLAFSIGDLLEARNHWTRGVNYGDRLLATSVTAITINRTFPNLYNTGDGVREYTLAWDYIARCANGIHLLEIGRMDVSLLDGSFSGEYASVTADLVDTRQVVIQLVEDLVQTREVLVERTRRLEDAETKLSRRRRLKWW